MAILSQLGQRITRSSALARLAWGAQREPTTYALVGWLFLRSLGCIYLIAFVSFGVQIVGLIGSNGILPAADFLQAVRERLGPNGYWRVPTLFWLNADDAALQLVCLAGAALSLLLIIGFARRAVLTLLFIAYLSLVSAGQVFMSFQWDILLLEAGFLAIFLGMPSTVVIWLFRWLVFRLIFLSGAVKLLSGDPTWRALTALDYHFETQPLPNVIAWHMHQWPEWFHRLSVAAVFLIEGAVPFLIFAPRRLRLFAFASFVFLQTLIFLSGNYTFFNLLTVALCLFLLDDAALRRVLPRRMAERIDLSRKRPERSAAESKDERSPSTTLRVNSAESKDERSPSTTLRVNSAESNASRAVRGRIPQFGRWVVAALAGGIVFVSGFQLAGILFGDVPELASDVLRWIAPFRIVNTYGLFAVMTTSRPEIVVEGSNDGATWLEYEFQYKPGDVRRPPLWVAPHQPRLDWQMWFAALGDYTANPWFANFMVRLLQGSPAVLALLDKNPFPGAPPRYVRAMLYDYRFSDWAAPSAGGSWWQRELKGLYFPAITLSDSG